MKPSPDTVTDPSDAELMLRAGSGDRDGFRELYRRLSKTLFSVAYKIVGNTADAEELVQETFFELWKSAPRYDAERAQPLTFAVRIVRNRSIDRLRKQTRRERISHYSAEDILEYSQSRDTVGIEEKMHLSEAGSVVREAFEALTEDQRSALQLAYFGGMSHSEIAEEQSEALGTVKSRIRRGLDRLRKELEGRL